MARGIFDQAVGHLRSRVTPRTSEAAKSAATADDITSLPSLLIGDISATNPAAKTTGGGTKSVTTTTAETASASPTKPIKAYSQCWPTPSTVLVTTRPRPTLA